MSLCASSSRAAESQLPLVQAGTTPKDVVAASTSWLGICALEGPVGVAVALEAEVHALRVHVLVHDAAIVGSMVPVVLALELARNGIKHRLRSHGEARIANAPGPIKVVNLAVVGDIGARVGRGRLGLAWARGIGVETVGLARECEIAIPVGELVL